VKGPRFRIAWVMVAVAIAALDFAAIRAMLGSQVIILLVLGALPMANVLAIGILVGQRRLRSRPFLLGFEVFGATALASFLAYATLTIFFPGGYGPLNWYLAPIFVSLEKVIGQGWPFVSGLVELFVYVFMLGWPQVAFALIGGFLSRRFKITITRR
jgi:hypothetical protein